MFVLKTVCFCHSQPLKLKWSLIFPNLWKNCNSYIHVLTSLCSHSFLVLQPQAWCRLPLSFSPLSPGSGGGLSSSWCSSDGETRPRSKPWSPPWRGRRSPLQRSEAFWRENKDVIELERGFRPSRNIIIRGRHTHKHETQTQTVVWNKKSNRTCFKCCNIFHTLAVSSANPLLPSH